MKHAPTRYLLPLSLVATLAAMTSPLCAKEPRHAPKPPPTPDEAAVGVDVAPAPEPLEPPAPAPAPIGKGYKADFERQAREMASQISEHAVAAGKQARAAAADFRNSFHRGDESRTLVLPTTGVPQPELFGPAHEDLSVMTRILVKTVEKESHRGDYRGFTFALGDSRNHTLDAMYLEGYGAVFLLNADFPLAAPPQPELAKAGAKDEDTTWERTKHELRGRDDEFLDDTAGDFFSLGDESPKYEAEKVNSLRRRLVESLKHAKNLKMVKDDEHVTIVIFGKSTGKRSHVGKTRTTGHRSSSAFSVETSGSDSKDARDGKADPTASTAEIIAPSDSGMVRPTVVVQNIVGYVNTDTVRQTTLVIRAKKSDIIRFAGGQLTSEEFAKAVSASAY